VSCGEITYKFGSAESIVMSFVELNIEEDFERYDWDIITNTETEFHAEYGFWTITASHEPGNSFYVKIRDLTKLDMYRTRIWNT
jgi:hypothetical protein